MRIHTLMFKNINSLKGEWRIDFDDPQFAENGIFCISGPTGSGKTTVLDAICLGLYHQTPRLKVISASANELMTRHTAECYSEVTFSSNGIKYRARWEQHRAGRKTEGSLQNARAELCEAESGRIIANQLKNKLEKIADITGLNFERFTRSVLLAQGSFTAFLKAEKKKKAELLEEITGTEIYGDISIRVFEKMRQEELFLKEIKAEEKGLEILSEEEIEILQKQYEDYSEEKKNHEKGLKKFEKIIAWFEKQNELKKLIKTAKGSLSELQKLNESYQKGFLRLKKALPALRLKIFYDPWQTLSAETDKNNVLLRRTSAELVKNENITEKLKKEHDETASKLKAFAENRERTEALVREKIIPLDEKIQASVKELKSIDSEKLKIQDQIKLLENLCSENLDKQKALQQNIEQLNSWLKLNSSLASLTADVGVVEKLYNDFISFKLEHAKNHKLLISYKKSEKHEVEKLNEVDAGIADIKSELKIIRGDLRKDERLFLKRLGTETEDMWIQRFNNFSLKNNLLTQLKSTSVRLKNLKDRRINLKKGFNKEQNFLKSAEAKRENLSQQLKSSKELFAKTREIAEKDKLIQDLQRLRDELNNGDPCPLCGSEEHPFSAHPGGEIKYQSAAEVEKAELKFNETQKKQQDFEYEVRLSEKESARLGELLKEIDGQILAEEKTWSNNCTQLDADLDLNNPMSLMDYEAEFSSFFSVMQADHDKIQNQSSAIKSVKDRIVSGERRIEELGQKKKVLKEKVSGMNKLMASAGKSIISLEERIAQTKGDLMKYLPERNDSVLDNKETFISIINSSRNFAVRQEEFKKLKEEEKLLAVKIKNDESLLARERNFLSVNISKTTQLSLAYGDLQREREFLFGKKSVRDVTGSLKNQADSLDNSLKECLKSINSTKQENAVLTERITKLKQQIATGAVERDRQEKLFNKSLMSSPFKDIEEFLEYLIPEEEIERLTRIEKEMSQKLVEAQTRLVDSEKSLKKEQEKSLTLKNEAECRQQLRDAGMRYEDFLKEYNLIHFTIEENSKRLIKQEKIIKRIFLQEEKYKVWDKLSSLIGARDGQSFRNFAQGLTLDHLVNLANVHLERLYGRYLLKRQDTTGLDLDVIDTFQADTVRPVDTLSGGESFLVSLALALALSDLASNTISIDSLFLDEGFGTLDSETLDIALDALDNLNASGKMIGIISHIESLKERIPCSIQLTVESGLGCSRLDSVYAV